MSSTPESFRPILYLCSQFHAKCFRESLFVMTLEPFEKHLPGERGNGDLTRLSPPFSFLEGLALSPFPR